MHLHLQMHLKMKLIKNVLIWPCTPFGKTVGMSPHSFIFIHVKIKIMS